MSRASIAIALMMAILAPSAHAEDCEGDTCVAVSADDENHLVITVKKGKPGSESTTSPGPKPTPSRKSVWIPWLPKPTATPIRIASNPRTSRPRSKPRIKRISGRSLADQVKRALPNGLIIAQPMSGALLREPVNFFTTIPPLFRTVVLVLGVPITIEMQAEYRWHFPSDDMEVTRNPGAPYPLGGIRHSFEEVGPQPVRLEVIWRGNWRTGSISGPIKGSIRQSIEREVFIHPANSLYTK